MSDRYEMELHSYDDTGKPRVVASATGDRAYIAAAMRAAADQLDPRHNPFAGPPTVDLGATAYRLPAGDPRRGGYAPLPALRPGDIELITAADGVALRRVLRVHRGQMGHPVVLIVYKPNPDDFSAARHQAVIRMSDAEAAQLAELLHRGQRVGEPAGLVGERQPNGYQEVGYADTVVSAGDLSPVELLGRLRDLGVHVDAQVTGPPEFSFDDVWPENLDAAYHLRDVYQVKARETMTPEEREQERAARASVRSVPSAWSGMPLTTGDITVVTADDNVGPLTSPAQPEEPVQRSAWPGGTKRGSWTSGGI